MAEPKEQKQEKKPEKKPVEKPSKEKSEKDKREQQLNEVLVRILGYDVPGSRNIYTGLIRIKGVSWSISNATCLKLGLDRAKKIMDLTKPEIQKIEHFLKNMNIPDYMKNRRTDIEEGKTAHLLGTDLDISKDFDIKRLRKIKAYKGVRHALGQPVRGQRTKSHFRKNKVAGVGGRKK
jgi:small subunit ribosomal protein S13